MFGSSRMLFMNTQSYILYKICVTANQLHSYCLSTMILAPPCYTNILCTALDLHKSFGATFMPSLLYDLSSALQAQKKTIAGISKSYRLSVLYTTACHGK